MNGIRRLFNRWIVASFLLASLFAPIIAQGIGTAASAYACEGNPGQCPCPGC